MIKYKLLPDGAFVCGDTETRRTVYSYPTSPNAVAAKKDPEHVATQALRIENGYPAIWYVRIDSRIYNERNWERLEK